MADCRLLISIALLFSLLRPSISLPSASITEAAVVLSNSGFASMAMTLNLISNILTTPELSSATIFAPSDEIFARFGQPPLSLLQFHLCPYLLSLETLRSHPLGSKIPTMNANHSLMVTSSPSSGKIEINGVGVVGSAVYDDGRLAIFEIEKFFDPQFQNQAAAPSLSPNSPQCSGFSTKTGSAAIGSYGGHRFRKANQLLRSSGYSVMASFLGMQLMGSNGQEMTPLTVFSPRDESLKSHIGNFTDYPSVFLRHVVPCKLPMKDLVNYVAGTTVRTALEGFMIEVEKTGDSATLNGVRVTAPDMYHCEWLSIHGVGGVLVPRESNGPAPEPHPIV